MKRFLIILFWALIVNVPIVEWINIILDLEMSVIDVIAWAIASSLIGVTIGTAIRYAIKLAKGHEA